MQQPDNGPDTARWSEVIVMVSLNPGNEERVFPSQGDLETCASWCLTTQRVRLLERYISRDGLKQIYVFTAPDAEAVRAVVEAYFDRATARLSTWPTRR